MKERVEKLQKTMKQDGVGSLLLTRDTEVRYLSGEKFEAGSTVILVEPDAQFIITDGRFENELKNGKSGMQPVIYDPRRGLFGEAGELLKKRNRSRVSVAYSSVSHADYCTLTGCGVAVDDSKPYLDNMRMVKDAQELALIRKACAISDASFEAILGKIRPGVTEREVANLLESEFRRRGGDGLAFETIVASGPVNGANCHSVVSDRKLENGDSVTIDFGTTYEGYCSDITRTVFLGKAPEELRKVYGIVKEAKKKAAGLLREGVMLKEIAAAGVGHIEENGYRVPHGIGHSFGYEAHEPLFISIRDDRRLGENMVTTLEPGVYLPGVGGIRLEDDYFITASGAEQLTHCTDDLLEL